MEDEPPKNWVRWDTVDKYPELLRRIAAACKELRDHLAGRGIYSTKDKRHGEVR